MTLRDRQALIHIIPLQHQDDAWLAPETPLWRAHHARLRALERIVATDPPASLDAVLIEAEAIGLTHFRH